MANHETPYAGAWDQMLETLDAREHDAVDPDGSTADVYPLGNHLLMEVTDGEYLRQGIYLTPQDALRIARKLQSLAWAAECAACPENNQEES